ncbi:arabinogalactan oligomer / maltooligosaccharide transport system permease protein [Glycomyces harbinensis]|uniref:Arabinogalactan oligomer / maltooligosaccharide transport system permease protein n=1 Tax=Glycomyces harbinensis TaxID=58114 RepID=A0A1G6XHC2_9ACTN|nr:arabinogalactan oligomer / maltooligosaccharide transport system permease protein [Glycomyces harbinensis]
MAAISVRTGPRRRRSVEGRQRVRDGLTDTLIHLLLLVVAVIVIFPLLWVVGSSFGPSGGLANASPVPENATFDNYVHLFTQTNYGRWYLNSLYVAVINMVGSVGLSALCGWVFARIRFRGRKASMLGILILQMFPSFLTAIAVYMLFLNFGLLDSLTGLALVSIAAALPYNTWLMKGYTDNLPASLDEAAALDGAGRLTIFRKIVLPLMRPMLTFVAITSFTVPWMDFILPRLLLQSSGKQTVALGLFQMITDQYSNDFTTFAAGAVVLAVPITILYIALQRHLVTGAMAGAEKG